MPSGLIGQLTVIRSWVEDAETQSEIDEIVRKALRKGAVPADTRKEPQIHRAFSSLNLTIPPPPVTDPNIFSGNTQEIAR